MEQKDVKQQSNGTVSGWATAAGAAVGAVAGTVIAEAANPTVGASDIVIPEPESHPEPETPMVEPEPKSLEPIVEPEPQPAQLTEINQTIIINGDNNTLGLGNSIEQGNQGESAEPVVLAEQVGDINTVETNLIVNGDGNAVGAYNVIDQGAFVEEQPDVEDGNGFDITNVNIDYGDVTNNVETGFDVVAVNVDEEPVSLVDVDADGVADTMITDDSQVDIAGENIAMDPMGANDAGVDCAPDYVNDANVDDFML